MNHRLLKYIKVCKFTYFYLFINYNASSNKNHKEPRFSDKSLNVSGSNSHINLWHVSNPIQKGTDSITIPPAQITLSLLIGNFQLLFRIFCGNTSKTRSLSFCFLFFGIILPGSCPVANTVNVSYMTSNHFKHCTKYSLELFKEGLIKRKLDVWVSHELTKKTS